MGSGAPRQDTAQVSFAQDKEVDQALLERRASMVDLTIAKEAEQPGAELEGQGTVEDG
ncbi:hypothetical protein U1Q18_023309, partial [Sarracenia purpurea var. burkii]